MPSSAELWAFLSWGYLLTVALETPVLLLGLSSRHGIGRRVLAGFWLTACTYPVVVLVLPPLVWEPWGRGAYLVVAETFAPLAECGLFYLAFDRDADVPRRDVIRDLAVVAVANLLSFGLGEAMRLIQ